MGLAPGVGRGHQPLLLPVSAATSSACGPRGVSLLRHPRIRRFVVNPGRRGAMCPPAVGAGGSRAAIRELPVSADAEPVSLGVEDALASSTPPSAAPDAEQHHGADQRARRRQCGHDRLPYRASPCQFMIIRVVAGSSGSGTYIADGDCDLLQTTGNGPQSSGGQRSPRRESTSSMALMAGGGPGPHALP